MKTCLAMFLALSLTMTLGCRCFSPANSSLPGGSGYCGGVDCSQPPGRQLWEGGAHECATCQGNCSASWGDAGCGLEHCSTCAGGPGCGLESTCYRDPNCGIQSTGGCAGGGPCGDHDGSSADGNFAPIIDGSSLKRGHSLPARPMPRDGYATMGPDDSYGGDEGMEACPRCGGGIHAGMGGCPRCGLALARHRERHQGHQGVIGKAAEMCAGGGCGHSQGPTRGAVMYPYYTTRGPRDFLMANPPSIGP